MKRGLKVGHFVSNELPKIGLIVVVQSCQGATHHDSRINACVSLKKERDIWKKMVTTTHGYR